MGHGL